MAPAAIYRASMFIFIFSTILGALNAVDASSTTGPLFNSTEPGVTADVRVNMTEFNSTMFEEQLNPRSSNGTILDVIDYYTAQIWASVGFIYNIASGVFAFFKIALGMGHYLHSLIPFIPEPLAYMMDGIMAVLWGLGLAQFLSGRTFKGVS